jgi:hypothetical protein
MRNFAKKKSLYRANLQGEGQYSNSITIHSSMKAQIGWLQIILHTTIADRLEGGLYANPNLVLLQFALFFRRGCCNKLRLSFEENVFVFCCYCFCSELFPFKTPFLTRILKLRWPRLLLHKVEAFVATRIREESRF